MNQAARRRLNIILTRKAILMLILVFASTACDVTGVQCIDDRTGEPLKQVRDVDGQLWSVEKAVEELGTLTLEYCGVSINVPLGGEATYNTDGEVYHPGTGEPIRVEKPYQGMRKVDSFVERPVRDGPWSARVSGREAPRAVGC